MGIGLTGFLQGIAGQVDPVRQAQVAQARQQIADTKTANEAAQLAGLFALSGQQKPQVAQPAPFAPAPQAAPMAAAPQPAPAAMSAPAAAPQPAPSALASKPAPRATQMMSPAAGVSTPTAPVASAAPSAADQGAQGRQFNGFASTQNFNDVLGATQGALQEIQGKIVQQYRAVHGTDPDPGVLMKATDMVIGQMHQLSPDVSAGLRLNAMQQHNEYLQNSLDERSRQFDANQERLQQAEQDKIELAQQNAQLKRELADKQAATSRANAATRAGATIQAANIRASTAGTGRNATADRVQQSNNLRAATANLSAATRAYQMVMNDYNASDADKQAAKRDYQQARAAVQKFQGGGAGPAAAPKVSNW